MKFEFTEVEYNQIVKKAMLNEELARIFWMKIHDYSIVKISMEMHMSIRTVNRRVNLLKRKIMKVL